MHRMQAIVLAAGKGTRMKSELPKVLHKIGDKSMIHHALRHLQTLGVERPIVVVGHAKEQVMEAVHHQFPEVRFAIQEEPLGTAHAVRVALPLLDPDQSTLITMGDQPFLSPKTYQELHRAHTQKQAAISLVTAVFPDPGAYGRIVRGEDGEIERVVELKNALEHEKAIQEVNLGCYEAQSKWLLEAIPAISPNPVSHEYYLTDLIHIAVATRQPVGSYLLEDYREAMGINSAEELAQAEEAWAELQKQHVQ